MHWFLNFFTEYRMITCAHCLFRQQRLRNAFPFPKSHVLANFEIWASGDFKYAPCSFYLRNALAAEEPTVVELSALSPGVGGLLVDVSDLHTG